MHKIHEKEFEWGDFSYDHLRRKGLDLLQETINALNEYRELYLNGGNVDNHDGTETVYEPNNKDIWWQMIQLLPSSYNQTRNVMLNYEVLCDIYEWRKDHKLDEWREFCKFIESLPYSELVTEPVNKKKKGGLIYYDGYFD